MDGRNVAPGFEEQVRQQQQHKERGEEPRSRAVQFPGREKFPHPEGKVARPHRCNDRLEDLIQALFEGDLRKNLPGPARLLWQCLHSSPGEEPTEPFSYLKIDPPGKSSSE